MPLLLGKLAVAPATARGHSCHGQLSPHLVVKLVCAVAGVGLGCGSWRSVCAPAVVASLPLPLPSPRGGGGPANNKRRCLSRSIRLSSTRPFNVTRGWSRAVVCGARLITRVIRHCYYSTSGGVCQVFFWRLLEYRTISFRRLPFKYITSRRRCQVPFSPPDI